MGRAGLLPRSPYSSSMQSVNPAVVRGRRLNLPREICRRCRVKPTGMVARPSEPGQKSAEGKVGPDVGKASEALQSRKVELRIGRTGNGDAKARTRTRGQ
jgi:hypothetical protein